MKRYCLDCGVELVNYRAKRCKSCNFKHQKSLGKGGFANNTWNKGLKGIHLSPESEFKSGYVVNPNPDQYQELQFSLTTLKKRKIRESDRTWFDYWLGANLRKEHEIHHDWRNGGFCLIIPTIEHHNLHNGRGNPNERE